MTTETQLRLLSGIKQEATKIDSTRQVSGGLEVEGYLTVYGERDTANDVTDPGILDEFIERFNASGRPLPLLFRHRWDSVAGEVTRIWTDDVGVRVLAIVKEDTPTGRMVASMVRSGLLRGFSYFWVDGVGYMKDGVRHLSKIGGLTEVTLTPYPANKMALVDTFRGQKELYKAWRDVMVEILRSDGCLTRAQAEAFVSSGAKEFCLYSTITLQHILLDGLPRGRTSPSGAKL